MDKYEEVAKRIRGKIGDSVDGPDWDYAFSGIAAILREEFPMQNPSIDDLLLQEIYSLREKLKIAVAAIKFYDPTFDDAEFTHRLGAVDYEQLMEELNGSDTQELADKPQAADALLDYKGGRFYGPTALATPESKK